MNTIKARFIFVITSLSIVCLFTISGCKKANEGPSVQEVNKVLLASGTWKINNVKVDGVDQTSQFSGMTLQFQAGSYTTVNGEPVWPTSGSWTFVDENAMTVRRNDDIVVTISTLSEGSLVLELNWSKTTLGHG